MKQSGIAAALAFALLAAAPASASPVTAQGVTRGEVAEILAAHGMEFVDNAYLGRLCR